MREHLLGDLQYPLICTDYLVCPNEFMMGTLTDAYMIEKIFPGKVLMEGFAKNGIFLDDVRREELKSELGWDGLEIFAYVPDDAHNLNGKLIEIDANLKDDQLLLVDVGKYDESLIDFSKFMQVKSFQESMNRMI